MITEYRKYKEPEYGLVSPEVSISAPQNMDFDNPGEWRTACHLETIAELVALWKQCNCYLALMSLSVENIIVDNRDYKVPVRIYYPQNKNITNVMVFIHGGGFMMNNSDVYDQVNRYLAYYGNMIVISPDYRLCPEDKFPKGLEDIYKTIEWASNKYGKANIFVAGDSAGGNLAAASTLLARDRKGPEISGQILIYPLTSFNVTADMKSETMYGKGHFLEYNSKEKFLDKIYLEKAEDADSPYVSPLGAESLKGLPPVCFLSAECDPILDQALMYAARLEDEGVQVEYHIYKGMIHAFINRPHHQTIEALNQIIEFVNKK